MKRIPIIAIGLDSGDPELLEKWMNEGHLKTFSKLRENGGYGRIHNTVNYCGIAEEMGATETLWPAFITGCRANTTGFWDIVKYDPKNYNISCDLQDSGYDYEKFPPFYALEDNYKIAIFDLPYASISQKVNGIQLLGWGGTYPYNPNASNPSELYGKIVKRYGKNPILYQDYGAWWQDSYIQWEISALADSIAKHAAIAKDFLQQDQWDLFLMTFNETHTAGHDLYHCSDPRHPLYSAYSKRYAVDPVLETYKNIDRAIGEILATAPQEAYVLCFSLHGMGLNYSDLMSQTFLSEILYRFSFPGQVAIAPGQPNTPPPPVMETFPRNSWHGQVWASLYEPNPIKRFLRTWTPKRFLKGDQHGLRSPFTLLEEDVPMSALPVMWYQSLWPKMKAFALPGFADGHIRINLKGREQNGIVTADEYDSLCEEISQVLLQLRDARTGQPVVKKVVRTRRSAMDYNATLPDSDLVALWYENEQITDVVDSPDFGRIGPVPLFRTGSHWERGFLFAQGPGIAAKSTLPVCDTIDLPPTILNLMGAPIPDHFEGKVLLNPIVDGAPA